MILTGLVTAYPLVVGTQVLWGLGWACSGGADVAWLTDELAQSGRIAQVLAGPDRWDLTGGATGVAAFGLFAWVAGLSAAIVASGAVMALLGAFVAVRFPEDNFTSFRGQHWAAPLVAHKRGMALPCRDREIWLVLVATMAFNGAGMISWLFTRRLVELGLPGDPAVSYAAAGILSSAGVPGVSDQTIGLVLEQLSGEGKVRADGTGRSATWTRRNAAASG